MKVAILYICTGKYRIFWQNFYLSSEKYFIPEVEKDYFVFTDADRIEFEEESTQIHKLFQENLGWPGNTLGRYEVFLKVREQLKGFDFVIYLNANLSFVSQISASEFLPVGSENLVACLHPGYFDKPQSKYTYEQDQRSTAYIGPGQGKKYFAGGINGGKSDAFITAMETMDKNIKQDSKNGITAVWHDESHWNRYLAGRTDVKILTPAYLYPEGLELPFEKKIVVRDKKMLGGHTALRGRWELRLALNDFKARLKKMFKVIQIPILICIKGGLGNQMFQYAYGRARELQGEKVVFDLSFYSGGRSRNEIGREYKLDKFKLQTRAKFKPKTKWSYVVNKINAVLGEEYFQSEKYFSRKAEYIKQEFELKEELSEAARAVQGQILSAESVSLHIRRGDYVSNPKTGAYHGVCGVDYYNRAMNYVKEKAKNPIFFVFSDDIIWVKENFKGTEFRFVSCVEIKDYEELSLMSLCKHNIIANSSFSWWGAWLNQNPCKIVIAPQKWFTNPRANKTDIVPKAWIKL